MTKSKTSYTYNQIREHLQLFISQMDDYWGVLTIEVFSDDSGVILIDVNDKKLATFRNMQQFMDCPSYEEATSGKYPAHY